MNLVEWELIKQGAKKIGHNYFELIREPYEVEIGLHENGETHFRIWYRNNTVSRNSKEGPAEEYFNEEGHISYYRYLKMGKLHRDPNKGPAYESFYRNGKLASRQYSFNDLLSRDPEDGPAYENYTEDGELVSKQYYLNGKCISNNVPAPHSTVS